MILVVSCINIKTFHSTHRVRSLGFQFGGERHESVGLGADGVLGLAYFAENAGTFVHPVLAHIHVLLLRFCKGNHQITKTLREETIL